MAYKKKMVKTKNIAKNVFFTFILFSALAVQLKAPCDYNPNSPFQKDCTKENKQYIVKDVFDGDTILVETRKSRQEKIRLLGIDAYEYNQLPYGKSAKDFLTKLVLNKKVCVETDVEEKDIYDRTLGYVFLDKTFINEEAIKNGLAILYNFPPNVKYINKLKKAQSFARENMLGIWEKQDYIKETPSEWRHKHLPKKK